MKHYLLPGAAVVFLAIGTGLAVAQAQAPAARVPAAKVADASLGPAANMKEGYLEPGVLDGKSILGPPPAPDSPHGKADRQMFEDTRSLEGSERWKTAIVDNDLWKGGALKRFSCAMGISIDETQTPAAWKIMHKIEADVRTVGTPAKDFYDRKRPMLGNDKPICVPREDWQKTNASYPSGHAMVLWSWALILTETRPEKADALLEVGREGGDSRVVCGVHFISDVQAGRTLGSAMVARLHADPEFRKDLAKAKQEIAKAKRAPESCAG